MPRHPRIHTRPHALVEVVNRTIQGLHLLKPGLKMNARIIGALAKYQQKYGIAIYSGAFAGNHFHLLISSPSVKAQADFLRDVTRKLSIESGKLYEWEDSTFPKRYRATEVSDEPEAQIARLKYHLRHGCKENLVDSPLDWPGVPFAEALVTGEPLRGVWIDRSAYCLARRRNKDVTLEDFTEHLELNLAPLPCWALRGSAARRSEVVDIVGEIEAETAFRHVTEGTKSLGAEGVLNGSPHARSEKLESGPKPLFHAFSRKIRDGLREALLFIVAAYREAAERLASGELEVAFPENTFPPALAFVEPFRALRPELLEPG